MADIMKVFIPFSHDKGYLQSLEKSFQPLCKRKILRVSEEIHQPDRRALDAIIFDALKLTPGERDAVYEAVVNLVEKRLQKAGSLRQL